MFATRTFLVAHPVGLTSSIHRERVCLVLFEVSRQTEGTKMFIRAISRQ